MPVFYYVNMENNINLSTDEQIEYLEDGKIKVVQNVNLYRFTSDSILLSKFASYKKGDKVADFCSGSGVVGFNFYALNDGVQSVTLFEMQEELFKMSEKSIALNELQNFKAINTKLQDISKDYNEYFSLILCNPPYERGGFDKGDYSIALCRKEITITLQEIVSIASKKLKFGGRFALVHRADRLGELMFLLKTNNLEPKKMQFVSGNKDAKPYLVLVEAVKGGKVGLDILPNIININN